jgi:hypothetical protein
VPPIYAGRSKLLKPPCANDHCFILRESAPILELATTTACNIERFFPSCFSTVVKLKDDSPARGLQSKQLSMSF